LSEAQNVFKEKKSTNSAIQPSLREYKKNWIVGYMQLAYSVT